MTRSTRWRTAYAAAVFFTALGGEALRYSIHFVGYAIVAVALAGVGIGMLVRARRRGEWGLATLPFPLLAFLAVIAVSTAWSHYPAWTALAVFTTVLTASGGVALAVLYRRDELLDALGIALRVILSLSLLFEAFVALVVRQPVLPLWYSYPPGKIPIVVYWCRGELFEGGRIQGILGNSNLMAFAALLGLIVFALQFARRWGSDAERAAVRGRFASLAWVALAALLLLLTRSATVTVALLLVAAALGAVLLLRRIRSRQRQRLAAGGMALGALALLGLAAAFSRPLLALLGKSPDLTGRFDIWATVSTLAQQRPMLGWGWVSYWVPWADPFDSLVFRNGVRLLQAHNAWLDLWFQVGVFGLAAFAALALSTLARAWTQAVDRPQFAPGAPARFEVTSLLPLLVVVALLAQSLAESRLLIEYGILLLVLCATWTKRQQVGQLP